MPEDIIQNYPPTLPISFIQVKIKGVLNPQLGTVLACLGPTQGHCHGRGKPVLQASTYGRHWATLEPLVTSPAQWTCPQGN